MAKLDGFRTRKIMNLEEAEEQNAGLKYKNIALELSNIPELSKMLLEMSKDEFRHAYNIEKIECLLKNIENFSLFEIDSVAELVKWKETYPEEFSELMKSCETGEVFEVKRRQKAKMK